MASSASPGGKASTFTLRRGKTLADHGRAGERSLRVRPTCESASATAPFAGEAAETAANVRWKHGAAVEPPSFCQDGRKVAPPCTSFPGEDRATGRDASTLSRASVTSVFTRVTYTSAGTESLLPAQHFSCCSLVYPPKYITKLAHIIPRRGYIAKESIFKRAGRKVSSGIFVNCDLLCRIGSPSVGR